MIILISQVRELGVAISGLFKVIKTAKRWSGNLNLVHLILTYFPKLCYLDFHVADKSLKNTF